MIRNVIFDFGDVIARFDPDEIIKAFEESPEYHEDLKKAFFEGDAWQRLDEGTMEYEDYGRLVKEKLPQNLHRSADGVLEGWYRAMPYMPGIPELILELKKKGYQLYILSNASVYFAEMSPYFEVTEAFDGKIFSGCVKMAKPNPEIYRHLLKTYSLKPEECIFIDDRPANIQAAGEQGIQGILFQGNVQEVREYLESKSQE